MKLFRIVWNGRQIAIKAAETAAEAFDSFISEPEFKSCAHSDLKITEIPFSSTTQGTQK